VVISGDRRLSLKKAGALLGDKALRLASARDVVRVTGFQVGSVSVLGFRRDDIAGYVDRQVLDLPQVIISAGRPERGHGEPPWRAPASSYRKPRDSPHREVDVLTALSAPTSP